MYKLPKLVYVGWERIVRVAASLLRSGFSRLNPYNRTGGTWVLEPSGIAKVDEVVADAFFGSRVYGADYSFCVDRVVLIKGMKWLRKKVPGVHHDIRGRNVSAHK
jgi:hypothetical protein